MKTYSVKQIAELLDTNPETVRRWIRNGKLQAIQESRKDGNSVSEDELEKFLKKTPKYATNAGRSLIAAVPVIGIPIALGGLLGELVADYMENDAKTKNARVSPEEIVKYLKKNISSHTEMIKRKREAISQLETEIAVEEQQIKALQATIDMLSRQLMEE